MKHKKGNNSLQMEALLHLETMERMVGMQQGLEQDSHLVP